MEFLLRGCDVPETKERAARFPISSCIGLGLQGSQSCLCDGGLLPHHFTLTFQGRRFIFCCTGRKLTFMQASPIFTGNPALWCPDFPLFILNMNSEWPLLEKLKVIFFNLLAIERKIKWLPGYPVTWGHLSAYTIRPHWSHWVIFLSTKMEETTSFDTRRLQPLHLWSSTGAM